MAEPQPQWPATGQTARGPHPLGLFLALTARRAGPDPARLQAILAGLRRYQDAPPLAAMPAMPAIARRGGVSLRLVGGDATAPLVVVVPSLINAPMVLDLAPGRSLVRHLAGEGFRVLLLDWGPCGRGERRLGLAGLVSARLLPLLRRLDRPLHLVGYCLGGTLALAAAQHLGATCRSLALIATPWHFDGFDPAARRHAGETWGAIAPVAQGLGALPISLLNPLFWSLDEDAVIAKFETLARRAADDPEIAWFAAVEDWANSGAPLSRPAARDLFEAGFRRDHIGRGRWRVGGAAIRPEHLSCPVMDFGATRDRIVPASARLRSKTAVRQSVPSGHVGMIVGANARAALWEPLSNWLKSA